MIGPSALLISGVAKRTVSEKGGAYRPYANVRLLISIN